MRIEGGLSIPEPGDQVDQIDPCGFRSHVVVTSWTPRTQMVGVEFDNGSKMSCAVETIAQGVLASRNQVDAMDVARAAVAAGVDGFSFVQSSVLVGLADAGRRGLTDAAHRRSGLSTSVVRGCRVKLVRQGLVEDSGERRHCGPSDMAAVWRCTSTGFEAAISMRLRGVAS